MVDDTAVIPSHDRVLEAVARQLRASDPDGSALSGVEDVDGLARILAARAIDATALWLEHLGPMYSTTGVAELLGGDAPVSRQAVHKRHLLALRTASGRIVYPAFQFTETGGVVDGVVDVVRLLEPTGLSSWTVASWFTSPDAELAGATPIEALRAGGKHTVLSVVERWASSLR